MKKINIYLILFLVIVWFTPSIWAQESSNNDALMFSMKTKWTDSVSKTQPWNIYPRPQLKRDNWINLNGQWDYAITNMSEEIPVEFDGKILVPFPVESALSGVKKIVGDDKYLWYRTEFELNKTNIDNKWILNFGAVDWETTVYVNGKIVGGHKGGFTPFSFNISNYIKTNQNNELIVRVWDPTDSGTQARGKQVNDPKGIWYSPVTGIWQTVWLENTGKEYITMLKATPDIDKKTVKLVVNTSSLTEKIFLKTVILDKNNKVNEKVIPISSGSNLAAIEIEVPNMKLWSPEDPFLYNLSIELISLQGQVIDHVDSYFGMRKISLGKDSNGYTVIMLNNEPVFQFGLLDQGWWPDGLYTAPTFEAMVFDIDKTIEMGFNMLRKHVKVEPATFYYECDKRGMLVWQDMPNGNYFEDLRIQAWEEQDANRPFDSSVQFEWELKEMMDHLHSFPSIVVWVPFNEGWGQYDTERVTKWTQNYDPSRLIDSPSGWTDRGVGDMIDAHLYPGPGMEDPEPNRASVLGEFGGLGLIVEDHLWWDNKNWGYLTFKDAKEFENNFEQLIDDLRGLKSRGLSAAIYTQTTDVEGEVNGLITYDRKVVKVNSEKTKKLFEPLYRSLHTSRILLSDSEHQPTYWKVNIGNEPKNWNDINYDHDEWKEMIGPFSSYENFFLPIGSDWNPENKMQLRKEFYLNEVPSEIYLKYYLDKAKADIYINGVLITSEKFEGGRKRHYRSKQIKDATTFLKPGHNVISINLESQQNECSFDLGIYSADLIESAVNK